MAPNVCFPPAPLAPLVNPLMNRDRSDSTESIPLPLLEKILVKTISKGGVAYPFPFKLHMLLDSMDADAAKGDLMGKSIVGWQPHGRAFKVHNIDAFVKTIMPHFFKHTKYASFQRQLNLYGFIRITTVGPDKGAVYHPCFVRNQMDLVSGMVRRRVKGTKIRRAVQPETQPNFYADAQLRAIAAVDAAFEDEAVAATHKKLLVKATGPPTPSIISPYSTTTTARGRTFCRRQPAPARTGPSIDASERRR